MNLIQYHQFQVTFLTGLLQERNMLEEVSVQLFIRQGQIRLYIIREFDDLQVYPFFCQLRLYKIQQFRMGHRSCSHFYNNFLICLGRRSRRFFAAVTAASQHQHRCHRNRQYAINELFHVSHSFTKF